MKKRLIILSIVILVSIINISNTGAWLVSRPPESITHGQMGTVQVKVIQNESQIQVKSLGTSQALVRVMLIPQWSDESLSSSNVDLLVNESD